MLRAVARLMRDDSGAVLTEYGVVLALLSGVALLGLSALVTTTNAAYTTIATNMQNFQVSAPP